MSFRPGWKEFLSSAHKYYDIYIYTSMKKELAEMVTRQIEVNIDIFCFSGIISAEGCYKTKMGKIIKDLRLFHHTKLENMVIVDSSVYSFPFTLDNGIPIMEWSK